jgi:hypothetical protein
MIRLTRASASAEFLHKTCEPHAPPRHEERGRWCHDLAMTDTATPPPLPFSLSAEDSRPRVESLRQQEQRTAETAKNPARRSRRRFDDIF